MGIIKAAKLFYDYVSKNEQDEVENVIHAVAGVDLDVEAGQFIAILGHNGSGKSHWPNKSMRFLSLQEVRSG